MLKELFHWKQISGSSAKIPIGWYSGSNLLFVFAQSSDHNEEDEDEVFERFMSEQLRYNPSGIDRDSSSIWKSSGRFAHKIQQKSIQIYANVLFMHVWVASLSWRSVSKERFKTICKVAFEFKND